MADRKESAADISVSLNSSTGNVKDIAVERLTVTKNIDIEAIYGSGRTLPDGYAINEISYEGTMELKGDRLSLEEHFFDDNGIPEEMTITITHMDGGATVFSEVLATSEGYESNAGEATTTTYEFVAMGKETDGKPDQEP